MALKQAEQFALDSLTEFVGMLASSGQDKQTIETMLQARFAEFEDMTKLSLKLIEQNDGQLELKVSDTRRDFVRTRENPTQTMLSLRSKIAGVAIEVKVVKDDESYSNAEVAVALTELSAIVSAMPIEMTEQGHADWSRTPGEAPKSDNTNDDGDDDTTAPIATGDAPEMTPDAAIDAAPDMLSEPIADLTPELVSDSAEPQAAPELADETRVAPGSV